MKQFISGLQLDLEEFADYMIKGEPSFGKGIQQKAKRLNVQAERTLGEIGACVEDLTDRLINGRKKSEAEKFIDQAENLSEKIYLKLKDASRSSVPKSLSSALERLMQTLNNAIDKIRKAFHFLKKHLLSPASPTILHHEKTAPHRSNVRQTQASHTPEKAKSRKHGKH